MNTATHPPPAGTGRLLHGHGAAAVEDLGWLCERLLEDGDRDDLAWLFASRGETAVAGWVGEHGERRLSPRSAHFWRLVLGLPPRATPVNPLWPA